MGRKLVFEVRQQDTDATPAWQVGTIDPPLSIREAIQISEKELPKYFPQATDWKVESIELLPMGQSPDDKWFYVVSWRPLQWPEGDDLGVPVLMSGRAMQGRFEK